MPKRRQTSRTVSFAVAEAEESERLPLREPREAQGKPETRPPDLIGLRASVLASIFVVFLALAVFRLASWQMAPREERAGAAVPLNRDDARGRIVDSTGLLLATDALTYDLYIDPTVFRQAVPSADRIAEVAAKSGMTPDALRAAVTATENITFLAKDVTREQCDAVLDDPAAWIWCKERRFRRYPQGSLGAHILGFTDSDQRGQYGIENAYDPWLRRAGDWGEERLPGRAEVLPDEYGLYVPSPAGRDLILHMVAPLQYLVERDLRRALAETGARAGTIIVMHARTSGILAMANYPTFDPNDWRGANEHTWLNPAVSSFWEPGSVFKVITYAAALDAGLVTPNSIYMDTGQIEVGDRKIMNADRKAHGQVTVRDALAESLNVVSANVCIQLGPDDFYRYVRQFGFGRLTEVDLNAESAGIMKRPGSKYWSQFDQAANSFGQGISVTPVQMAASVAAIANGGTLLQPQAVDSLVFEGQRHRVPQRKMAQVMRPETATTLTEMMVYTYEHYQGSKNLLPGFKVAGKTGTAQIPTETGYSEEETVTSFVGFFPAADPQVVVLVKLDRPTSSKWAEQVALPLFGKVAKSAVQVLKIQPNDRMP